MGDTATAGTDHESDNDGSSGRAGTLTAAHTPAQGTFDDAAPERTPGHWRYELRRWLATLNPGRTGREYEKAVSYFFLTSGVPGQLSELSFDLLLAYRGALALRAAPAERGGAYSARRPLSSTDALDAPVRGALPMPDEFAADTQDKADGIEDPATSLRPLAPATVNIRLTALRQFLVHCSMMGLLVDLSPDRIRMALKRLQIDRRRPYQILAESEWEGFLSAALTSNPDAPRDGQIPMSASPSAAGPQDGSTSTADSTHQRNFVLIALALATGLRAIELSLLNLGDVSREWYDGREEWWLVLPDEKSKGQHGGRTLPLAPGLIDTLMSYVRSTGRQWEDPADRATPLFLSRQGRTRNALERGDLRKNEYRLSTVQIRRIVDRVEQLWLASRAGHAASGKSTGRAAGETRVISPHALRHSTAVALLEGNASVGRPPASVEHVRGWLGHIDIRTTQGYLAHLESRRHRRALALGSAMLPSQAVSTDRMQNGATRVSQEDAAQADQVTTPPANSHAAEHGDKGMGDTTR